MQRVQQNRFDPAVNSYRNNVFKIDKIKSYFIPHVHPETTVEYMTDVFENRAKIGKVKRIDISSYLCKKTMKPKCRAFVHLECLYDTPFSVRFRNDVEQQVPYKNKLRHGGYNSMNFWTVLPYRNKGERVHSNPKKRIELISFESDPKEHRPPSPQYLLTGDYDEDNRPPSPDYPPDEAPPKDYFEC
tara:strand:- start:7 stop:567 length:561 start_codon:yes stop_codon:yes gene_type:complete